MFQISAKTDYGLLFMLTLAEHYQAGPVSLRQISEEKHLPYRFLSQIAIPLRHADLVDAKEGALGGYRLRRSPDTISVGEVLRALNGDLRLARCLREGGEENCPSGVICSLPPFWRRVTDRLASSFNGMKLTELLHQPDQALARV